jgi:integrase
MGRVYRPTYRDKKTGQRKQGAKYWLQYSHRGKKYREPAETTKKSEAVKLLNQRLARIREGKPTGIEAERLTFADLSQMLLDDYRANGNRSIGRAELSITHLRDFFGEDRALDITTPRITTYIAKRRGENSARATINRELAALRRMFTLAMKGNQLGSKPHFPMLAEDNSRKGFFEWDQYLAIRRHLSEDLQPVFDVAYYTGWRVRKEILTRQWFHVDLEAGWMRLDPGETKNRQGREFPLFQELRAVLVKQRERTGAIERATGQIIPWVFHRNGRPIKEYKDQWNVARKKAGLPGKIAHDFRRTAVRNFERAGVSRSAAMAMTGHLTESIYRRYAIVDVSMLKEGGQKLSEFLSLSSQLSQKAQP